MYRCEESSCLSIIVSRFQATGRYMGIHLYGLLRIDEREQASVNLTTKDFGEQISIYARAGVTLAHSLRAQNIPFTILTNRRDLVISHLGDTSNTLTVEEIPFTTEVPHGTQFYSAHFKLDAYRHLSTLSEGYVGLCDLDMICLREMPDALKNIVAAKIPLYYDISDQVLPAYGREIILKNLSSIHGLKSEGRWYGGEFLSGPPSFFGLLTRTVEEVYPRYIENLASMHHIGDEAYTSAAIELIRRTLGCLGDAGTLGIAGRYWNAAVKHPQKPFTYFRECFLLHLPADKPFLASFSGTPSTFLNAYQTHLKHGERR